MSRGGLRRVLPHLARNCKWWLCDSLTDHGYRPTIACTSSQSVLAVFSCFGVARCRGQERWVQIAALLESRTAGECKARYRQLSKEVKARKESLSAQQQMEGSGNGSEVDGVDAAARAKADRLLQLQVDAGTTSGTATKVQGVHVRAVPAVSAEIIVGTREHNSKDDAGAKEAPRKMKPSERRALKKAEKTARLEAKARKRAAAAASNGGSSDDEETGGIGQGNDTPGGGLGWGVIEL